MAASREVAIANLKNAHGKKPKAAHRSRAKANELLARGDDGLTGMVDNMIFWRTRASELLSGMNEIRAKILSMRNESAIVELMRDFNKTAAMLVAARDRYHQCAADVAPYTNPKLASIEFTPALDPDAPNPHKQIADAFNRKVAEALTRAAATDTVVADR